MSFVKDNVKNSTIQKTNNMVDLIRKLSPLRMAPNSSGLDQCVKYLCEELDFFVHEFPAGSEVNGWIVPQKWEVIEAKIYDKNGSLVYDGMHHPLAVIGYSQSFSGRIQGNELKKHLFFPAALDDALVYHCDLFYKPFRKEWGFSVTKNFYNDISDTAEYDVVLETSFEQGTMKVAEFVLEGESEDSIVINAHNCHAFCCNDDLSGVAAGIEVIRRLSSWTKRRYTYRLIIAPEHFGSIFYLDSLTDKKASSLKWSTFLEMVGAGGPLALQRSFKGNTFIDRAYLNTLQHYCENSWSDYFRKIIGNDETCWESAGYEIPCPSLNRSNGKDHYPEYHTSKDSPDFINADMMEESVNVIMEAFFIMENDIVMHRESRRGLISLGHPKHDLYKPMWDPSEEGRKSISDAERNWNYLMDCLPRYFDGTTRLIEVAERHNLPFRALYNYVKQFEEKGLIRAESSPANDPPNRKLPPY